MAKASWCKVSPASGSGNSTLNISADPHTGRVERSTTVTATNSSGSKPSDTVKVTQEAAAAKFEVTAKTVSVAAGGGEAKITGVANVSGISFIDGNTGDATPTLKVNGSPVNGWDGDANKEITDDPGAAAEFSFEVSVTIPANDTPAAKTFTCKLKGEETGVDVDITINQSAGESTISLTPESVTIAATGEAEEVTLKSNDSWVIS